MEFVCGGWIIWSTQLRLSAAWMRTGATLSLATASHLSDPSLCRTGEVRKENQSLSLQSVEERCMQEFRISQTYIFTRGR